MKRIRIAWMSSAEKSIFSRSEYFTRLVVPHLRGRFDIEIFTDSFDEMEGSAHYLSAADRNRKRPFDIFFYQVENGPRFHFLRSALGLHPGVTLFHDYYMTDLGPDPLTNSPWEVVVSKLKGGKAAWPERSVEFPRKGPAADREAGLARVPIFASARTHADYRRSYGDAKPSWYLPTPIAASEGEASAGDGGIMTIAFCGTPNPEHRAHKLLEAIHGLSAPVRLKWLIEESERPKALELLDEFRVANVDLVIGRTPEQWSVVLRDVSAAVHTLFSVFGSTEPYLLQSLAAGRAAVVSHFPDGDFMPDCCVWKVPPGRTEATTMRLVFEELLQNPNLRRNEAGRVYAEENHSAAFVAKELSLIFDRSSVVIENANERWREIMDDASKSLRSEQEARIHGWSSRQLKAVYEELGW